MAWLETERGDQIPLQGLCSIGRETTNNVILSTPAVSRRHAVIHEKDNEFWMVDLGGINGVQINGNRVIQPVRLQEGDRIQMPSASFTFRQAARAEPVSALPKEGKEPPQATPVTSPAKTPKDRKKPRSGPETKTPASGTPSPRNMCLTAKRSMYVGLASIFFPFIGIIPALAAIILGHAALRTIKKSNGALAGRTYAIRGLYFGYITLSVISSYTALFYVLYSFSPSSSAVIAKRQSTQSQIASRAIPSSENAPSPSPPADIVKSQDSPSHLPPKAIPGSENAPSPPPPAVVAKTQDSPSFLPLRAIPSSENAPSPPPPTVVSKSQDSPSFLPPKTIPSGENASTSPPPVVIAANQNTHSESPPGRISAIHDAASGGDVKKASASPQSVSPQTTQMGSRDKNGLNTASSDLEKRTPAASDSQPAVFSYERQSKLKEEMLALPMPSESLDSSNYWDADAFNNAARILARKPEAKYAESVQEFIEEVKVKNPDQARLKILSAMYENYTSALTKP